jgi:hypothetical protein
VATASPRLFSWGLCPQTPGICRLMPIPDRGAKERDEGRCPSSPSGLGPQVGARVASQQSSILRLGRASLYAVGRAAQRPARSRSTPARALLPFRTRQTFRNAPRQTFRNPHEHWLDLCLAYAVAVALYAVACATLESFISGANSIFELLLMSLFYSFYVALIYAFLLLPLSFLTRRFVWAVHQMGATRDGRA